MKQRTFASWVVLLIAVSLWSGVIYAFMDIESRKRERLDYFTDAQQQNIRQMTSSRLRAFMKETEVEREAIAKSVKTDVVSIVDAIDAAGKAAGVDVQISNAIPEKTKLLTPSATLVTFTIQSKGSFGQIMWLLSLLETLPMPVRIVQFDIAKQADEKNSFWQLNVQIRALTTTGDSL